MSSRTSCVSVLSLLIIVSTAIPVAAQRQRAVRRTPPGAAVKNSAQALESVAKIIYDALAAKQDLKPYIKGVMTAFGVPPLGEADVTLAGTRYSQGLPLMFIPQVAEMADAFNDGGFLSLDSFIAAANDRGAKQKGITNPLTRDYLTQKFAYYASKAQYGPGQALPAFVLALSKERAKRFLPQNPDPLWGDGLLDPLQLTLLLYSVSYSGAGPLSAQVPLTSDVVRQDMSGSFVNGPIQASLIAGVAGADPIGDFIKDQIQDRVTGDLQDFVELPLDKKEAAQVSVCASLLLYGHKMKVTTTPNLIYHKDGTKPSSTRVDATLTFQDDYWDNYAPIDRWLLENLAKCKLPRRGTVAGKPLEWSVSDGLTTHGSYDVQSAQTDFDGKGFATWKAVDETTPQAQRTFNNQRDAVGAAIVRAGSLVPGWSGLERIVGLLKDTGNAGDSRLTVIYYVGKGYRATGGDGNTGVFSGVVCSLEQPFTVNDTSPDYAHTLKFTPSGPQAGSFTNTGTLFGLGTYDGGGPYTVKIIDAVPAQLNLDWNNCFHSPLGSACANVHGNIDLVPLDTKECGPP